MKQDKGTDRLGDTTDIQKKKSLAVEEKNKGEKGQG